MNNIKIESYTSKYSIDISNKADKQYIHYLKLKECIIDLAINIVDELVLKEFIPNCTNTNDETENYVQDIIREKLLEHTRKMDSKKDYDDEDDKLYAEDLELKRCIIDLAALISDALVFEELLPYHSNKAQDIIREKLLKHTRNPRTL